MTTTYTGRNPDPSFSYPPQYWFPPFFTIQPNSTTRLAQFRAWSDLIQRYCRHHRIFKISVVDAAATISGSNNDNNHGGTGTGTGTGGVASDSDLDPGLPSASSGWPLFHNRDLSRRLDVRGISEVLRWMSGKSTDLGLGARRDDKDEKSTGGGGTGGIGGIGGETMTEGRAERLEGEEERKKKKTTMTTTTTGESGGTYWIFWRTPEEWASALMDWIERTGQKGSILTLYEIAEGEGSLAEEFHGMDADLLKRCLQILVKRGKAQIFGQSDQLGVKFF